jgi:hypothetical protein
MMNLTEAMMNSPDTDNFGGLKRILIGFGTVIGLFFCAGVIAGMLSAHQEHGGGLISPMMAGILLGVILAMALLIYAAYRLFGKRPQLTKKERLNRNILIGGGLGGGIVGAIMAASEITKDGSKFFLYSNAPISSTAALIFAAILVIIVPIVNIYWFRYATDEQEIYAYKEGTFYAFFAYGLGAPLWWILWRGGLVPAPDGIIIYYMTMLICCVIWLWKKYR